VALDELRGRHSVEGSAPRKAKVTVQVVKQGGVA